MSDFSNLAIMASAGTGKTYSLAMRYISLLKLGVEPEEIVAMTFTNKAAGEIFDKIIQEILALTADSAKLRTAIQAGNLPDDTKRQDLFLILRKILCAPKKLQISTLDSFFFNIINAFPLECGIAGEISMLNEQDDEQRVEALLQLIRSSDDTQRKILMELIKQTSLNTEQYSIFAPAKKIIETYYREYLKYPSAKLWNNSAELDSETDSSDILKDDELYNLQDLFLAKAEAASKREKQYYEKLVELTGFAVQYTRLPVDFDKKFENPVKTFFDTNPDWLNSDSVETKYYSSVITLCGKELDALKKVMRHLLAVEFKHITDRNRANYDLIRRFDRKYAADVRQNGKLTFKDITYLLKPQDDSGALALPFSDNIVLEERLDAKYNHYLLDEFQDTSDEQWRAISNLVDEIFQPGQERFRSFFYVGDIKQSIYQWRDGNPELFETLYNRYSDPGFDSAQLKRAALTRSYRSSVPVIETVNNVFMHPEKIPGEKIPEAIRKMEFEEHSSAPSAAKQPGYAALIECCENGAKDVSAESVFELLLALDPFSEQHDCSVGILTLENKFASEMAERFRELCKKRNLESAFIITVEGVMLLNNSIVFAIYRNLLILALHPADSMARGFLSMVALPNEKIMLDDLPILYGEKEKAPDRETWFDKISRHIRTASAANGFTQYARKFARVFQTELADFDAKRMDLTIDAAMQFDASGCKDIAAYIHFLDCIESKSNSIRKTVQFMTVHKSKGLDFDIVILPDLYTQFSLETYVNRGELLVKKDAQFQPCWVTHFPKTILAGYFSGIKEAREQLEASKIYEKCCQLYVAMTRARHALYLMTAKVEAKSETTAIRFCDVLKSTLAEPEKELPIQDLEWIGKINSNLNSDAETPPKMELLYACGNVNWIDLKTEKTEKQSKLLKKSNDTFRNLIGSYLDAPNEVLPEKKKTLLAPSRHTAPETGKTTASPVSSNGALLGTHLHDLFMRLGFLEETNTERLLLDYLEDAAAETTTEMRNKIASIFRQAISTPDAAELFARPAEYVTELWREKKFCIRTEDAQLSSIFDRVVILRDFAGNVVKITLIDYKSDLSSDPEYFRQTYSPQLETYARLLKQLFLCEPEKVIFMLNSGKKLIL